MASNTIRQRMSPGEIARTNPRAATILRAIIASLAIWVIAKYVGQVDMTANDMTIGPFAVIAAALIAGLVAWGLLAALERRTDRAWTIWRNIALIVLVISMLGPLGGATPWTRVALGVMHGMGGAIIITGFSHTVRRK